MLAFARVHTGTSAGAWGIYQAALAARALHDSASFAALAQELRQEYPGHLLALRLTPASARAAAGTPVRVDCGPRSLLHLCRQARIRISLPELTARCRMAAEGTTLEHLEAAAHSLGFRTAALQVDADFLRRYAPSGILRVDGLHYVAISAPPAGLGTRLAGMFGRGDDRMAVWDPGQPDGVGRETPEALVQRSLGIALLVARGKPQPWERALPSEAGPPAPPRPRATPVPPEPATAKRPRPVPTRSADPALPARPGPLLPADPTPAAARKR
jgi:hypothetical protein